MIVSRSAMVSAGTFVVRPTEGDGAFRSSCDLQLATVRARERLRHARSLRRKIRNVNIMLYDLHDMSPTRERPVDLSPPLLTTAEAARVAL